MKKIKISQSRAKQIGQAFLAVVGVNLAYGIVYLWSAITIFTRSSGYDATGHGAIFAHCSSGSGCMGPNHFLVACGFLAIVGGFVLAGYVGAKIGNFKGKYDRSCSEGAQAYDIICWCFIRSYYKGGLLSSQ